MINEVMRLVLEGIHEATEVVSSEKLGINKVTVRLFFRNGNNPLKNTNFMTHAV
jgi:hypothetical protein